MDFNIFKKIIDFFVEYRPVLKSGALEDPRPKEEKAKDVKHSDIGGALMYNWFEYPQSAWRTYPVFNQDGSYSCGANAGAKALGIEALHKYVRFVDFSRKDIYQRRDGYPNVQGMYLSNIGQIICDGVTLESLRPSDGLNESQINDGTDETKYSDLVRGPSLSIASTITPVHDIPSIDELAAVIEPAGKPVILRVVFTAKEWQGLVPQLTTDTPDLAHFVCATQATLFGGKKSRIISDSWGAGGYKGLRVLTEEWFLNGRVTANMYLLFK
jgi:hypothetical protein